MAIGGCEAVGSGSNASLRVDVGSGVAPGVGIDLSVGFGLGLVVLRGLAVAAGLGFGLAVGFGVGLGVGFGGDVTTIVPGETLESETVLVPLPDPLVAEKLYA